MFRNLMSILCTTAMGMSSTFAEKNVPTWEGQGEKHNVSSEQSPKTPEAEAFFKLPLTEEDKVFLRQIIQDFSDKSIEEIMQNREGKEHFMSRFETIHPLRFAGFVFSDPYLKQSAIEIMNTDGKSHLIVALLMVKIKKGMEMGTLNQYMPGFIEYCRADGDVIHHFIDQDDFRGLINYLLELQGAY